MKPNNIASDNTISTKQTALALIIAFCSFVLLSPKWLVPVCAWTGPVALLAFYRYGSFKKQYLWLILLMILAQVIAFNEVVPIPGPGLFVFVLFNSFLTSLPYVIDRAFSKKHHAFPSTFIFPLSAVAVEFISSNGPWGVWNSLANTQFSFPWLIQIASVTGIWGISFLFYWFASFVAWLLLLKRKRRLPKTVFVYPSVFAVVLLFGAWRYNAPNKTSNQLKVAGVSVNTLPFLEALYNDVYQKPITLSPDLSPVSPELQKANLAMLPFIEQPDTVRFRHTLAVLSGIYDSLFVLSRKAVLNGAQVVEWSEGSAIMWKQNEPAFLSRARNFARENNVSLVIAMAAIETGKLAPDKKFMENKAIYIDRNGAILNTLFKNKPVPGIEPTKPGDGTIPAISTEAGIVSTSICYDADFPSHMQQLGKQKTGLLFLPSGDWKAISPYHTNAAIIRAIENGCSIVRQVSGGLSVAADYRGKIYGSRNYFEPGDKIFIADVPVMHIDTIYTQIGDSFAYISLLLTACFLVWLLTLRVQKITIKIRKRKAMKHSMA